MTTTKYLSSKHVTEELTMHALTTLFDLDAPANVVDMPAVREPDFYEYDMAYWIGQDAIVACEMAMASNLGAIAMNGTNKAVRDEYPAMHGVAVTPFDPEFLHAAGRAISKHGDVYSQWLLLTETVLA